MVRLISRGEAGYHVGMFSRCWPWLIVSLLVLSTLWIIYSVYPELNSDSKQIFFQEAAKSCFQLLIVVIGGILVKTAVSLHQKSKQEAINLNEFRVDFLRELRMAYVDVKKARRKLRAGGLTTKFESPPAKMNEALAKIYKCNMEKLNCAQLDFEESLATLRNLRNVFGESGRIQRDLSEMKSYLHVLIDEFQAYWPKLVANPEAVDFSELEHLADFTGSFRGSQYSAKFVKPSRDAIFFVRCELLPLPAPKSQ